MVLLIVNDLGPLFLFCSYENRGAKQVMKKPPRQGPLA